MDLSKFLRTGNRKQETGNLLTLIFAANFKDHMGFGRGKSLMLLIFSLFALGFTACAQDHGNGDGDDVPKTEDHKGGSGEKHEKKAFDADEVIFGHVLDAHEFHFFSWDDADGEQHHATIPLPVILYSKEKGFSMFMSSKFHHGEEAHEGYRLITRHYLEDLKSKGMSEAEIRLLSPETIVAVNESGQIDNSVKVYDLSLTRNVVQMLIALTLLVLLLTSVSKRYRQGEGIATAPKGWQNAIEPVVTFLRDEVAKPNIGHTYKRYMPLLLTIFFFILINNIFGMIPGSANVTGNIAFTLVLGVISFLAIMFSTNKHYWGHIFWPPVPHGVKVIMIPVEILSIFTKPFALIIRLFANMLAGHIIIICLISLIFIFGSMSKGVGWGFSVISLAFTVFIYMIEVLVAFIQAFIFTNLTAVFIGQAAEGGHDEHHEENHAPDRPLIIG